MTKNSRLKDARVKSGKSQQELADILNVSQAYINGLENDKPFSLKKAKIIADTLGIDAEWLYFGDKKVVNIDSNKNVTFDNSELNIGGTPSANNEKKGVPYYDVDFMGGFDMIFNNQAIQPSFYIDFLPFNDCDCWINVSGKSMGPLIAHGDIVGLKKVDNWHRFLLEGEIYAVITDNGFRTIKILGAGPDKDHYMLIPYNKSEEYQPQVIPKEVITHIFRVKGNIKKFF